MATPSAINILKTAVFWGIHAACLGVIWVGISPIAVAVCAALYLLRMFAITGGYHRYFSHRTYKTSRLFQFILAFIGASSAQKGPLWWAGHHRHHHRHSDTDEDIHPPSKGLWWAHVGWVVSPAYLETRMHEVKDLARYPELRFIDEWHLIAPVALGVSMFALGLGLEAAGFDTNGWQMLIWGFFISTTLVYHGTFVINSLTHKWGRRRFATTDNSRNSFILSLITLGEGWHNNHHRYPGSERQGFYWWEIDLTHYALTVLSWFGIVWDLRKPPAHIYEEARTLWSADRASQRKNSETDRADQIRPENEAGLTPNPV